MIAALLLIPKTAGSGVSSNMADTPRTLAFLLGAEAQDGQTPGSYTLQDLRDFMVSVLNIVPDVVSAAGTTQGTATVLVAQLNIVSTVAPGTGVVATAAYTKIWNVGLNDLKVYPISGAQFNTEGTNVSMLVPVGGAVETTMNPGDPTQGYAR